MFYSSACAVDYREEPCRTAMNRVSGMPFAWSLNPYMGCAHRCTFCYVRAFEQRADRPSDDRYGRSIRVKINVVEVLRRELARKRWAHEGVVVGAATDPYQPAEGRYRLTRGCLEAFAAARNPFSIITRGPMIVRDVDVLAEASRRADVHVTFSVPTLDDAIWRTTEPGTAPPRQRLRALRTLVDAGIDAGVGMAPILPGLSRPAGAPRRRREGRPRRRRDRDLDERPVPPARDPRALPREPRPRLAGARCRATSGSTPAGRTSARRRSSRSGGRSPTSATGSRSADRRTVRLLPSPPDAQLELPLLVGGESKAAARIA